MPDDPDMQDILDSIADIVNGTLADEEPQATETKPAKRRILIRKKSALKGSKPASHGDDPGGPSEAPSGASR